MLTGTLHGLATSAAALPAAPGTVVWRGASLAARRDDGTAQTAAAVKELLHAADVEMKNSAVRPGLGWAVRDWAPEFGGRIVFRPPEKSELVLAIGMGCTYIPCLFHENQTPRFDSANFVPFVVRTLFSAPTFWSPGDGQERRAAEWLQARLLVRGQLLLAVPRPVQHLGESSRSAVLNVRTALFSA